MTLFLHLPALPPIPPSFPLPPPKCSIRPTVFEVNFFYLGSIHNFKEIAGEKEE